MKSIPDHLLDAFVDKELDQTDRGEILSAMKTSPEVAGKVAETRHLKDLFRLAYQDEKPVSVPPAICSKKYASHTVAAVLGAISMLILMQVAPMPAPVEPDTRFVQTADTGGDPDYPSKDFAGPEQVLFHLSSSDSRTADVLLDQVELVASQYARSHRDLRILVVSNNEGLRVFESRYSEHAQRISDIYARYDNIVFAACGTTLRKQAEMGQQVDLLPEVIVVDSGVAEITRRQQGGWKYIRI